MSANVEVLAFTAEWCSDCQRDKPKLAALRNAGVKVTTIDVDKQRSIARKYGVTQLPTYIVLQDGVEIKRTGSIVLIISVIVAILQALAPLIVPLIQPLLAVP
jgi:thiol-disulfide isomerase/thioredoxin